MGHVNIRAFNELFEQSIWQLFNHMGITPSVLRQGEIAMATVTHDLGYLKELSGGDVVYIKSHITQMTAKKVVVMNTLCNAETDQLCATCQITAVCLDPVLHKSRAFPEDIYDKGLALVYN